MKPGYDGQVFHWDEADLYFNPCFAKSLIGLGHVFEEADYLHNTVVELQFKL